MNETMLDAWMMEWMGRTIDRARMRRPSADVVRTDRLDRLKLLFAGYNGAYNMGADVRVIEMIRQIQHLLGEGRLEASVFRYDDPRAAYYFPDAHLLQPEVLFPRYLNRIVPEYDGVIACEGSTFKSKFTDLLSAMMVGAMGLASANKKLSIAYGAEAGAMTPSLTRLVSKYCRDSYIVTRNAESADRLEHLGLHADVGTDTAWTFEPLPREYGEWELAKQGWRGEPILTVCAINPFWWPVQVSLRKAFCRLFGMYRKSHYARVFFFQSGPEVDEQFTRYLEAIARAVQSFCRHRGYFPVFAASENLDQHAMKRLAALVGGAATFRSRDYDIRQFVSILRCSDLMVSSRYHAVVTSMPGGVVSAGLSMDERLDNLMHDRGHSNLLMHVEQPELSDHLQSVLEYMHQNSEQIRDEVSSTVVRHLGQMSAMGRRLLQYIHQRYPQFGDGNLNRSWDGYLPPFSPTLARLAVRHEDAISPVAA